MEETDRLMFPDSPKKRYRFLRKIKASQIALQSKALPQEAARPKDGAEHSWIQQPFPWNAQA